jgi:uncharacterized protein (DUF2147 family)
MLRKAVTALFIHFLLLAQTPAADKIAGLWDTPNNESQIRIFRCAESFCGKIEWMKNPVSDTHNPDANLRKRPLVGLQIMTGFRYAEADTWSGGT